ncbi:MAG: protein-export chaperone SecB [Proteobacteria bacterium]|nr:protein-export chaperone SecB [Pseudomonadota bacterium]
MAEKKSPPAAATAPSGTAAQQPGIQVVTQYVKDMSFENPHAPESLVSGWPAPETNVQISLGQHPVKENLFESSMHLRIEAKNQKDGRMSFIIDLHYGALVALANIPKENYQAILMVEVPKLLFPFVRELVCSMTTQGGYPPLYLAPISFEAIYMNELKRAQAEQGKKSGNA